MEAAGFRTSFGTMSTSGLAVAKATRSSASSLRCTTSQQPEALSPQTRLFQSQKLQCMTSHPRAAPRAQNFVPEFPSLKYAPSLVCICVCNFLSSQQLAHQFLLMLTCIPTYHTEEPLNRYRRSCAFCPAIFDILHPLGSRKFVCGNDKDRFVQQIRPCKGDIWLGRWMPFIRSRRRIET